MSDDSPETWRPFPGYAGYYEISSVGRARSLTRMTASGIRTGRMLNPYPNRGGYLTVHPSVDGHSKRRMIHQAVCEAWHGPCPDGLVTRHLDGNKLNNTPGNLKWGTPAENSQDMLRHGTNFMASKTHCPAGHPYEGDNLVLEPNGGRKCRVCLLEKSRRLYREHRDEITADRRQRRKDASPEQVEARRAAMRDFKERRKQRVAAERISQGLPPPTRNADKTVCKRGHPLSGDNLYVNPKGQRQCRTCRKADGRARYAARVAQREGSAA